MKVEPLFHETVSQELKIKFGLFLVQTCYDYSCNYFRTPDQNRDYQIVDYGTVFPDAAQFRSRFQY